MALINRMSRLFTADVHAVLDRIEEPDVLLKHAIREMDEELARSEQRVRQLEHEREALAERQRKVQAALAELVSQLDVCFSNANDELARKVVKRKLETEKLGQHVAERSAAIAKELADRRALRRRAARAARRAASEGRAACGRAERRRRRMGPRRLHRDRGRGRGRVAARAPVEEAVMSARNESAPRPSFGASLGMGLVLSLCGAAVLSALGPTLLAGFALRAVIAMRRVRVRAVSDRQERRARGSRHDRRLLARRRGGAYVAGFPLAAYVLVHVGLIWLVRSLYYYSGVLPALADFGLGVLGVVFAVWAAQRTGSAWLAFWCFFLAQSFHVLIPQSLSTRATPGRDADDTFNRAHRTAEEAIRRLSTAR